LFLSTFRSRPYKGSNEFWDQANNFQGFKV